MSVHFSFPDGGSTFYNTTRKRYTYICLLRRPYLSWEYIGYTLHGRDALGCGIGSKKSLRWIVQREKKEGERLVLVLESWISTRWWFFLPSHCHGGVRVQRHVLHFCGLIWCDSCPNFVHVGSLPPYLAIHFCVVDEDEMYLLTPLGKVWYYCYYIFCIYFTNNIACRPGCNGGSTHLFCKVQKINEDPLNFFVLLHWKTSCKNTTTTEKGQCRVRWVARSDM